MFELLIKEIKLLCNENLSEYLYTIYGSINEDTGIYNVNDGTGSVKIVSGDLSDDGEPVILHYIDFDIYIRFDKYSYEVYSYGWDYDLDMGVSYAYTSYSYDWKDVKQVFKKEKEIIVYE